MLHGDVHVQHVLLNHALLGHQDKLALVLSDCIVRVETDVQPVGLPGLQGEGMAVFYDEVLSLATSILQRDDFHVEG